MDNNSSKKQRFTAEAEEISATPPVFLMPSDSCPALPADTMDKINALINKLTQECLDSNISLKSIGDALKVETLMRQKWENLQKKTEKEMSLIKIEFEKKLDEKKIYIGLLEKGLNAMKDQENKLDLTFNLKFKELNEQVQSWLLEAMKKDTNSNVTNTELIDQLHALESLNQTLIVKEREGNDMLQEVRKALLKGMCDLKNQANVEIGIKMMGVLDVDIFDRGKGSGKGDTTRKYEIEAVEWCTIWQKRLNNPKWYPFRVTVDEAGNSKESLDHNDNALQKFKEIWGRGAYDRFTSTFRELNEYNPSGRSPVPEFWNFKENRKASMEEVIRYIFRQMNPPLKRMRSLK